MMPSLEDQLRRYGDVLDNVAIHSDQPAELTVGPPPRRGTRTALVAVGAVVVVSLIAVASSARSTKEPTPATSRIVAPTTTQTTADAQRAAAQAEARRRAAQAAAQRAAADAWIVAHGGRVVDVHNVVGGAMSDRAIYVMSQVNPADPATTLSRVDRQTLRVLSVPQAGSGYLDVAGNAVYLITPTGQKAWTLERLDRDTLQPLWTVRFAGAWNGGGDPSIAGGSDAVWVSFGNRLERLDGHSGRLLQSLASSMSDPNIGASIALDPTGRVLWVVYGDSGGGTEPIEIRDARTGARLAFNRQGAGSVGAPAVVATGDGAWVSYRTGMNGGASLYRASDLKRAAELVVGGGSSFTGGVGITPAGKTIWAGSSDFLACADTRTGQTLHELARSPSSPAGNLNYPIAADPTSVAVTVAGTLGIFRSHDLCPHS